MNLVVAIDVSTFIWDQTHFSNKTYYYSLVSIVPTIYERITAQKICILFRKQLLTLIQTQFPYNVAGKISKELGVDFKERTFSFLTKATWIEYADNRNPISSTPEVVKSYFSDDTKTEVKSKIWCLLNNQTSKYIAYNCLYGGNSDLSIQNNGTSTSIETLSFNTEKDVSQFFDRYKITFQHNQKHGAKVTYANGEKISPFACYHQSDGQLKAQQLLDGAFFYQNDYYNFDLMNNVYVRFLRTDYATYHGHDLSNEQVPHQVKQKFNKNGRIF